MKLINLAVLIFTISKVAQANTCIDLTCETCLIHEKCRFIVPFSGEASCVQETANISAQMILKTKSRCRNFYPTIEGITEAVVSTLYDPLSVEPAEAYTTTSPPLIPTTNGVLFKSLQPLPTYPNQHDNQPDLSPTNQSTKNLEIFQLKLNNVTLTEFLNSTFYPSVGNYACPSTPYHENTMVKTVRNMCRGYELQGRTMKSYDELQLAYYHDQNPTKGKRGLCSYLKWMRKNCM